MLELSRVHTYLRLKKRFPSVWCPGCGSGSVMGAIVRAIDELGIPKDNVAFVSGIGCTGRMPVYLDFNTMHTTHGRALAFATGIKLYRNDMKVIVVSGDGDSLAIGGNHFIHAARRNIDISLIILNNGIYGMTGGQVAPTTPAGAITHTLPYGNFEHSFDTVDLAISAGATFVSRSTVHGIVQTTGFIKKAIDHPGFSVTEVISQCPVQFGRLNSMADPKLLLKKQKDDSIPRAKAEKMSEDELKGKIITGIFKNERKSEYTAAYREYVKKASEDLRETVDS